MVCGLLRNAERLCAKKYSATPPPSSCLCLCPPVAAPGVPWMPQR